MTRGIRASALLALALASCGGGAPPPQAAGATAGGAPDAGRAPPAAVTPSAPGPTAAPTPEAAPGAVTASVEITGSKMIADIKAIGIDLTHPGDLAKIELSKKKKIMPFFVKALGYAGCEGCHVAGDFKADTHNKRMASAMWTHFVRDLRTKGGGALFCDSCHQGKQKLLARSDKKVLSAFMRANYEEKLERTDKKDHSCETCHSDPFEGKIFAKLWKVGP